MSVLSLNNLVVSESNNLIFGDGHRTFSGIPASPNYASDSFDQDQTTILNSIFAKLSENSIALESLNRYFTSIESFQSLTSQVSMMRASCELFNRTCYSVSRIYSL